MKSKSRSAKSTSKRKGKKKRSSVRVAPHSQIHHCEVDVPPGLEPLAFGEMRHLLGRRMRLSIPVDRLTGMGAIPFTYSGNLQTLLRLQMVLSVYTVHYVDITRPTGLLGHHMFSGLVHDLQQIVSMWPPGTFESVGISAAGSDSGVMVRLRDEFAKALGLQPLSHEMDLVVRLRRPRSRIVDVSDEGTEVRGWEVLMRLSPRPLSVRYWRVCDMEGALNAAVAHAMIKLTHPKSDDLFLNLMAGSGTLLIERVAYGRVRRLIGCDLSPDARLCADRNLDAAGINSLVELHSWDARDLHLPDKKVDAIVADLPFGFSVGSHDDNVILYPAVLQEAARVAKPGAKFVAITQEIRLMEQLLADSDEWLLEDVIRIQLRGLHPRIFVMKRLSS